MANVSLGSKAIGSVVKLNEDGVATEYIVVHQGKPSSIYDDSCTGTWLLRKDLLTERRMWSSDGKNKLETSDIYTWLNDSMFEKYDSDIQASARRARIPYRQNGGINGTDRNGTYGLLSNVFLLSGREIGIVSSSIPQDGSKLDYFLEGDSNDAKSKRIARRNGTATLWWSRSPYLSGDTAVLYISSTGGLGSGLTTYEYGIRPALILPENLLVLDDGLVKKNTAPTTPANISLPSTIHGGIYAGISWGISTDAEDNLEGYSLERSIDSGNIWAQIYRGNGNQTTNFISFGTEKVIYRVKAYDSEGLESEYRTSDEITVINNHDPAAPQSITVPLKVVGGESLTITWSAGSDEDGDLTGYILQRKVGSGSWTQIYKGNSLSYQDTIGNGWQSVQYRVCAYDSYSANSTYTTSETRTVDNNTAPTISCDTPSGSNLGTKSSGFSISYSVDDVDSDAVNVTESMDGTTKRIFDATLEATNQFQVTGTYFQQLLNGQHTMKIVAQDADGKNSEHTLTFTKSVTSCSITMQEAMEADAPITIMVMSIAGDIPSDVDIQVLVTNNANDTEPVWEDATLAIKNGANYPFENGSTTNGYAFNFRLTISRGESGIGGYVSSIQGGFQ